MQDWVILQHVAKIAEQMVMLLKWRALMKQQINYSEIMNKNQYIQWLYRVTQCLKYSCQHSYTVHRKLQEQTLDFSGLTCQDISY